MMTSGGGHARTPINYGGRRIGYQDLLNVIQAEKRGVKIDLHPKPVEDWTLQQQLDLVESRRKNRLANS